MKMRTISLTCTMLITALTDVQLCSRSLPAHACCRNVYRVCGGYVQNARSAQFFKLEQKDKRFHHLACRSLVHLAGVIGQNQFICSTPFQKSLFCPGIFKVVPFLKQTVFRQKLLVSLICHGSDYPLHLPQATGTNYRTPMVGL
jgi:hypothetical protein